MNKIKLEGMNECKKKKKMQKTTQMRQEEKRRKHLRTVGLEPLTLVSFSFFNLSSFY